MRVYFKTFGCRTNIYDTELIKKMVQNAQIVGNESEADIIVVNSCTVTNGADSDVRGYISRMNRSGKRVILTGCGAKSQGQNLLAKNQIFGVFGMSQKAKIDEYLRADTKFYDIGDLEYKESSVLGDFENHTKAFIKIQEGCDFSCAYCIIPSVRGHARSIDENLIINEARNLAQNGFSEIVLTGTNIGSYGKDSATSLGALLQRLGSLSGIKRIRLGSIEPSQIDESFREILGESFLERHLHIALQHTSQTMLSIMRRRNTAFRDLELFLELGERGFALGTDFIVAHPGESEEVWGEAVENFKKFPLTHLHAFIFSPRWGTASASMSGRINGEVAKARLKMLKNIVALNNFEFRKAHKSPLSVLVERKNGECYEGYDEFYNKILIKSEKDLSKKWVRIEDYEVKFESNVAEI
ncbi:MULTISPECIES: tRNA (N(6)-L-threonylcarbamoyladenosine(37)-C(2))-methylthiotransferase MtaB [unclassified Campylobacter]|uniref:tRNA (N(6)-L-threonylcarbamoyladenosine(37)-C(2))- methylthiotransferase MtaB n=1 Tax=unclassified Campylobacter TaxID=2593542 RepID=UPI0022E9F9E0|nr:MULTISPECIES: tRNA (N(6)-L-threonylcarbamoyladenosine(37)-C(2))-methylthiotransferase MtaB [unclassified Campylobacter]MDA3053754.1 tRNA (N(6)-L-threonylcarbamoyladenosine(37)-C(2))-methylthiotransferase MtaB [Campylobacter sp. VBCF_07 NA4]MDA3060357.1 tRNA (N(6)-L-threonylcarbamoyladenosine(37)-C(2))-methylthiotransferase MtaB [Campylobacter sp. VBCF_02 NA5]MDA3069867.1 tRNA (N(6)-L-threonylcarbamoyladenosine(37)-C(2))-methylthiotransferase MtaB [Campylobacter sp. VBCF_08 NA3]